MNKVKNFLFVFIFNIVFVINPVCSQKIDPYTCTYKGIRLYGKVQKVDRGEDITAEVVSSWPDIEVDTTDSWPSDCGEWKFVKSWPDFTVRFVNSGGDIKIRFVSSWPGVPSSAKALYPEKIESYTCTFKGQPLFGKVKVVNASADIKVKITESGEDLKVQSVENYADECGEWQFVDSSPDFTIQFVNGGEDIKIRFVTIWPGL